MEPEQRIEQRRFAGPLGPSSPMERPVSEAFNFLRMVRVPKRTSRPSNSITGSIISPYDFWVGCSLGFAG